MKWGLWGAQLNTAGYQGLIEHCLNLGITTFDHADIYGHYSTEAEFGDALAALGPSYRHQLELVTKCGIRLVTPARPEHWLKSYDSSAEFIRTAVENSLRNLRTDYLDLLLLHRPDPLLAPAEVAEVFAELKAAGKVLHFGVSNFTPSQFALLSAHTPLVTNQVEASPLHSAPFFDDTFDQLLALKRRPMAWSPLGGGQYFLANDAAGLRLRKIVQNINEKLGYPGEDVVLLAWLLRHPSGIIPVLGTSRPERLTSACRALAFTLDSQDWFAILAAARGEEMA
ncbi:MAG: aldo/keto reductase [Lewinella sp.]|nr:aldo/keto reductase [Lewinella sp.]